MVITLIENIAQIKDKIKTTKMLSICLINPNKPLICENTTNAKRNLNKGVIQKSCSP